MKCGPFSFERFSLTPAHSRWQRHLPRERENYPPMVWNDERWHWFMDRLRNFRI